MVGLWRASGVLCNLEMGRRCSQACAIGCNCGLYLGAILPDWAWIVLFIVGYIAWTQWLLPKLGVPT